MVIPNMIRKILHTGLAAFFEGRRSLAAELRPHGEKLSFWLSVLDAVTSESDLEWSATSLTCARGRYRLIVPGLGTFQFRLSKQSGSPMCDVDQLNFHLAK